MGLQNPLLGVDFLCHCAYPVPSRSGQVPLHPVPRWELALCCVWSHQHQREGAGTWADTALPQCLGGSWHQFWEPKVAPAGVCIWIIKPFMAAPLGHRAGSELSYLAFTFLSLFMVKFAFHYYELQVMKMCPQERIHWG